MDARARRTRRKQDTVDLKWENSGKIVGKEKAPNSDAL